MFSPRTADEIFGTTQEEKKRWIQAEAYLDRKKHEEELQRRELPSKILESLNSINAKLELLLEIVKNDGMEHD